MIRLHDTGRLLIDGSPETFISVDIGDSLFYAMHSQAIVVPCKVVGLDNVHLSKDGLSSVWSYQKLGLDNKIYTYHSVDTGEKDEGGWPVWKHNEGMPDLPIINQFFEIDEPIGHSIQLDEWDGCFTNLEKAIASLPVTKRRHLKRRLNSYRHNRIAFIESTHLDGKAYGKYNRKNRLMLLKRFKERNKIKHLSEIYPDKKIYVKTK